VRLIVLGASGFIGRRIVELAAETLGPGAVIAAVRNIQGHDAFPQGIEQRKFDAEAAESVLSACEDADRIINCVMGTRRAMVESCRGSSRMVASDPKRRLVHFSSIAVFGDIEGTVAEDAMPGHPADGYAAAKIEAERTVRSAPADSWTILRPGLVHGPGSPLWTLRIARLIRSRRLGPLGAKGGGTCNLVSVDDVAASALAACGSSAAKGRSFTLVADGPPTWNQYLEDMAAAFGMAPRPLSPVRFGIERALAYPIALLERTGLSVPDAITPGLARLFGQRVHFASSAVPTLLTGWQDYRTVLTDSAAWFRTIRKGC